MTAPDSLFTGLRRAPGLLRGIALVVAVAFTLLVLAPAAAAAREAYERQGQAAPGPGSDERAFSDTLVRLERRLARLAERLAHHLDTAEDTQDLGRLQRRLERLDSRIQARFARIAERLAEQGLPAIIRERHAAMVAHYRQALATLLADLRAIAAAPDPATRAARLAAARERLAGQGRHSGQQPFDPDNLPSRALRPDPANTPRTSPEQFRQGGLFPNPHTRLAALGDYRLGGLPGADDPAYLGEDGAVVLSAPIRAQAAALDHDPVAIYHWVRNHIHWQPGWGSVQDAELTLAAGRGNAMDIAALTIALLRASAIPARYVHGTIEVPAAAFRDWAGGFADIHAATDYAAAGGIPLTTVSRAGRIDTIRLEHIWVEAAIDYHPARGAVNRAADTWLPLDPSFKRYEDLSGLDVLAIAELDPEQLAAELTASATLDEGAGWISGLDPAILETARQAAQTSISDYVDANLQDPAIGEIIGGRQIIPRAAPVLPSALPNRLLTVGATYARLPDALTQRITWRLPGASASLPYAQVNNRRVTLSFRPATAADAATLQGLLPEGEISDPSQLPASLPAYLIQVVPELKLEGTRIAEGAPVGLGEEITLRTQVTYPTRSVPEHRQRLIAGSYLVVNSVAANVAPAALEGLQQRLTATRATLEGEDTAAIAALTREDLLGELFHAGSLGYFAQLTGLAHIAGLQAGGHFRLGAGLGTLGYEPEVATFFGIPRSLEPGGVALDIPLHFISGVATTDPGRQRQFNLQLGVLSSALEHAVPEQLFGTDAEPAEAISAVKALSLANAQGQRIYHLSADNPTGLAHIGHDPATMAEIQAALAVGKEVITHTGAVSVPGWTGAGYVILDPDTHVGAWKIAGGKKGGFFYIGTAFGVLFVASIYDGSGGAGAPAFAFALGLLVAAVSVYILYGEIWGEDAQKCFVSGLTFGLWAGGVLVAVVSALSKSAPGLFPAEFVVAVASFATMTIESTVLQECI
jgi:hypothetical protein